MTEPLPAPIALKVPPANDSIMEIVWRQRAVLVISCIVFLAIAGMYLLVATRYYSSQASMLVSQAGQRMLPGQEQHVEEEPETFLATQSAIVNSTPVIAMALEKPGIMQMKTFKGEGTAFACLRKNLNVSVGKKDSLIYVEFDSPYPLEAQQIVSAVVESYKNYQSEQRHDNASDVVKALASEKDEIQKELDKKQADLEAFQAKNGVIAGSESQPSVAKQRLEALSAALTAAQLESLAAKSAWDDVSQTLLADPQRKQAFERLRNSGGLVGQTSADDSQLRARMLEAQQALEQLNKVYLPNHPMVQRAQANVDQLNLIYASAVQRRWLNAEQKEAGLQKSFDQQQELAVGQNAKEMQQARLTSEVTRLQTTLNERSKQIQDFALTQGAVAPTIQLLDPPSTSSAPSRPHTLQTLALALLGGMVFGVGGACMRDWYDYRLYSAEEVKQSLGITVLGLIPRVSDENSPVARGQKIHIDPQSDVAEAYRSLRTAVYFGSREKQARSILVTSPERGDGKSTLASNLAIAMAQAGRRTLLIDADMRAPMQDLIFGINGRVGLAAVLQNKALSGEAIRHTGIENLDLLPAGIAARNPSELLNSQGFIDLLEELADTYEQVIIDSPPLLAVTDARIIAATCDATVLVLRAGKSNRKLSEMSVDGLISVGAKLLGAVVNDIQRRRDYRYYGSYGRYGYGDNGRSDRAVMRDPEDGHEEYAGAGRDASLSGRDRLTG